MASGIRKSMAWLLLASLATACGTPAPMTVAQEKARGRSNESEATTQLPLMRDPVVVKYVRDLGMELVKASKPSPFRFTFYVVEARDINAGAQLGAAVFINTGLILKAKHANELAGVLGHEIGHATARHLAQALPQRERIGFFAQLLAYIGLIASGGRVNPGGLTGLAAYSYVLTFSRDFEFEADSLGVQTLVDAGWDPNGVPNFFETLQAESAKGPAIPVFLRSHPVEADRIARARKQIADMGTLPPTLKQDDDKLAAIQARIRSLMGPDAEDPEDSKKKDKKT